MLPMENNWFEFDSEKGKIGILLPGKMPLIITKEDLDVSFFSTGNGGQHANRHMNGVRLIYHLPVKYQLPFKKTKELMSRCIAQRNREANFAEALKDLSEKVKAYFYVAPHRTKTKTPRSSKMRRLDDKKRHSQLKKTRHVGL